MPKETVVIDLGGSILTPELGQINLKLLKNFKEIIAAESKKRRFIIVIGGGSLARNYQNNARNLKIKDNDALDWLGIRSTQLNAELLKSYFGNLAFPRLITSEKQKYNWEKGVLISGGWHPGNSTDYIAIKMAALHQAKKVIVATNIDYIYNSDPKKNPAAKKYQTINWMEYNRLFKQRWQPGMTVPLDPKAAKLGQKIKIPLFFLDGKNVLNLKKALAGEKFKGTTIF